MLDQLSLLSFASGGWGPALLAGATLFAESRNSDTLPIRGIDFRRGDKGVGRVVVDLRERTR